TQVLRSRVQRLSLGMTSQPGSEMFHVLPRYGMRCDTGGIHRFLADLGVTSFDPEVIIVETVRRVLHGNENDAKDVGEFWHSIGHLLGSSRTLIVSHHMRKPNTGGYVIRTKDRASGSTDILGGADDGLAFTRRAHDVIVIEPVKCREA